MRDWEGRPLFPRRQVNPPIIVDLGPVHQMWLTAIHAFFKPPPSARSHAVQRAAGEMEELKGIVELGTVRAVRVHNLLADLI